MRLAEDLLLRGKAVQSSMMHLIAYNTAFAGSATVQAWKLGLTAPVGFWAAMGRASGAANAGADVTPLRPHVGVAADAIAAAERVAEAHTPEAEPEAAGAGPSPHLLDAPRHGMADDLTALKGIGPKLASALAEFGIYHFDQLATLDEAGIAWLDEQQPGFRMICARHDIVGQAAERAS